MLIFESFCRACTDTETIAASCRSIHHQQPNAPLYAVTHHPVTYPCADTSLCEPPNPRFHSTQQSNLFRAASPYGIVCVFPVTE